MKILTISLITLATLLILGWVGAKIQPRPFPDFAAPTPEPRWVPLPEGLPAPVARYFRQIYGEQIPVIESAVISGRATLRVNGITLPGRFRFTHLAGQGYRHYIESTFFGLPIMKVNEWYLDGKARLELPFGVFEGLQVDQAANLGMWSEAMWLPAILVTDPHVNWEAVDDETAILIIPFGEEEQRFIVRFDPETGLLALMEAMRYRDAEGGHKILWMSEARTWGTRSGVQIPVVGAAIWLDEGTPWAIFSVDETVYNADVVEYIRATGP